MRRLTGPLSSNKAFTLMELIVVVGVTGIIMVLISGIFVNIVQGNINATVTENVRSQGEVMIEDVARAVRNANQVTVNGTTPTTTTLTTTVTLAVNGNSTVYTFTCGNLQKNGSQMNATNIFIDTGTTSDANKQHCPSSYADSGQYSYFQVTPGGPNAPPQIKIVMTVYTNAGTGSHTEYATRQTLTQSSVQLGQYKK